jgi:hypothetical protein
MNLPESPDPAELLHRALRELPDMPAPRTLEDRVFAEIAARAAQPWWRQSAALWPAPAQVALFTASLAAAVGLTWLMTAGVRDGTEVARGATVWLAPVTDSWSALRTAGHALSGTAALVPTLWLYGLAAVGALSAALLGGGIAAYRTLCIRN